MLARGRGPALQDRLKRKARESGRKHAGIRDRGRRGDELGVCAVVAAYPPQTPQHLRNVGPEDAAIGVDLVDHDILQSGEKLFPFPVKGQQGEVEHIGVREDHVGKRVTDLFSPVRRGVSVIDVADVPQPHRPAHLVEAPELVLFEPLQWEEIQCPRARLIHNLLDHRDVVDEALAAGSRRHQDDVPPLPYKIDSHHLVAVECRDTPLPQYAPQPILQVPPAIARGLRVQILLPRHLQLRLTVLFEKIDEFGNTHAEL